MKKKKAAGLLGINPLVGMLSRADGWISSAGIVETLGVSRMAICKQVRRLKALGYKIESAPRRGYLLKERTARPVADEVIPSLNTRLIGRAYRYFEMIDSTNAFLRSHASNLPDGTAVAANAQSSGHGRFQRPWFSPAGVNIHLSVLLKPRLPPHLAPQLSLVAAVGVLRALHSAGCAEACVKWPNDILCNGKKIAGILCEMDAEADVVNSVVIGIGVNVNVRTFPKDLEGTATSLANVLGHSVSIPLLVAGILNRLDEEYAHWISSGLSRAVDLMNRHSTLVGREVSVATLNGSIDGTADTIDEDGLLRILKTDGTAVSIASGEVRLCRPRAALKRKG